MASEFNEKPKRVRELLGVLAGVLSILGVGYGIGQGQAQGLVDLLEQQKEEQAGTIRELNADLSKIKSELSSARITISELELKNGQQVQNGQPSMGEPSSIQEVSISSGNSKILYNGEVVLSVEGIQYEGSPLRHTVYGVISVSNEENINLIGNSPGHKVVSGDYVIRVLSSSFNSAVFGVEKRKATNTAESASSK